MPIAFPLPRSGTCANCGQHCTVSAPAFDVSCPRCHTVVMQLSTLARLANALAIAGVVAVLGGLLTLAVLAITGDDRHHGTNYAASPERVRCAALVDGRHKRGERTE